MFRKSVFVVGLLAAVFLVAGSAPPAMAATNEATSCPPTYSEEYGVWVEGGYCDGRLNAFDIDQPVAIYYAREAALAVDDDGNTYTTDAIAGIEVWAIDSAGQGQLAMWVPVEKVEEAFGAASDVEIAGANGISLNYSPSANALSVTTGSYTFSWDAW